MIEILKSEALESGTFKSVPRRNLPAISDNTRFFWESGSDGKLRFCRCSDCGHYIHPPAPACPQCRSRDVHHAAVSGRGTIATFTINRQAWEPGLEAPYVVALVELDEQAGLRLTTNVLDCPVEDIRIGMRVDVFFDHREDVWIPLFRPVGTAAPGDAQ